MRNILIAFITLVLFSACTHQGETVVEMETSLGNISVKLYDETPLHRDNFMKLVKEGYYDGMLFHRVIKDFMIQTGDPDSKNARPGMRLGENGIDYTLKPEFNPIFFHRKGVLAAAREGDNVNPERNSSGSHFYLVQGKVFTPESLDAAVEVINDKRYTALFQFFQKKRESEIEKYQMANNYDRLMKINDEISAETKKRFESEKLILSKEQKDAYTTIGGIPHLDGVYTIFGEIIDGMSVVDRIVDEKTDNSDRPFRDVVILKMRIK